MWAWVSASVRASLAADQRVIGRNIWWGGFATLRVSQGFSSGMEFNFHWPLVKTLMDRDQIIPDLPHIFCNYHEHLLLFAVSNSFSSKQRTSALTPPQRFTVALRTSCCPPEQNSSESFTDLKFLSISLHHWSHCSSAVGLCSRLSLFYKTSSDTGAAWF